MKKIVKSSSKTRDSRFELLRILSMLGILCFHFSLIQREQLFRTFENPSWIDIISSRFYLPLGHTGVFIFVLITGYFMSDKIVTIEKSIKDTWKIWSQVIFYTLPILLLKMITGSVTLSLFFSLLMPFSFNRQWFITSYIILILLLPLISKSMHDLSQKQFIYFCFLLIFFSNLFLLGNNMFNAGGTLMNGNGFGLLLPVFSVGYYIRKFGLNIKNKLKLSCLIVILIYLQCILQFYIKGIKAADVSGILPLGLAILIFLFVLDMKPFYNKYINHIAKSVFPVLIINGATLLSPFSNIILHVNNIWVENILTIIGAFATFFIIVLVDQIRLVVFRLIKKNRYKIIGIFNFFKLNERSDI